MTLASLTVSSAISDTGKLVNVANVTIAARSRSEDGRRLGTLLLMGVSGHVMIGVTIVTML